MRAVVIRGRVFDGSEISEDSVVVIDQESGLIKEFGRRGEVSEPEGSRIIQEDDATILPGLIDTHVHFFGSDSHEVADWVTVPETLCALRSIPDLRRTLLAGFTTIRELGSKPGAMLAQALEEESIEGPRLISCSRALAQTGGDDDPVALPLEIAQQLASYTYYCDGPWECRKAVRKVIRDQGKVVKVYASSSFAGGGKVRAQFTVDELKAIVDEAHRAGLKVASHAYLEEAIMNSAEAGVDSIEHGIGLSASSAELLRKKGIFYCPTLSTYSTGKAGGTSQKSEMIREHLTKDMEIARQFDLKIVNGSDTTGDPDRKHGDNHREIAALADKFGTREALVSATSRASECLGLANLGWIRSGFVADVVVVRGSPIEEISALSPENILHVAKAGRFIRLES